MKLRQGSQTRVFFKEVFVYENGVQSLKNAVKKIPIADNVDYAIELERNSINHMRKCGVPHVVKIYNVIEEKTKNDGSEESMEEFSEDEILYTQYSGHVITKWMTNYVDYDECMSVIASVLVSCISMDRRKFSHNDLHSDNVTIKSASHDYRRYVFPDETILTVKSYGKQPCLIDFGFSHCDNGEPDCKVYTPPLCTTYGIFPWWHDPVSDKIKFFKSIARLINNWSSSKYDIDPRYKILKRKIMQTYLSKYFKCYLSAHLYLITEYMYDVHIPKNTKDNCVHKIIKLFENELLSKQITPKSFVEVLNLANSMYYKNGCIRNRNQFSIKNGKVVLKTKCTFTIRLYEEDLHHLDKIIEIGGIERSYTDKTVRASIDVCYQSIRFENVALKLYHELKPTRSKLFTGEYALDAVALLMNQLTYADVAVDSSTKHSDEHFYSLSVLFAIFETYWIEACEMETANTIDRLVCLKIFLNTHVDVPSDQLTDMDHAVRLLLYEIRRYVVDRGVKLYKKKKELESRVKDEEFIRYVFNQANVANINEVASTVKYFVV